MSLPDKSLPFSEWYNLLVKPSWTPATATIGAIWGVLYPLIAIVYGYSLWQISRGVWPKSLILPILLNVVLNALFTPIQFGLRNFVLASIVVVAIFLTAIWTAFVLYPHNRYLAFALIPYIAWTGTASVLQLQITWLNR